LCLGAYGSPAGSAGVFPDFYSICKFKPFKLNLQPAKGILLDFSAILMRVEGGGKENEVFFNKKSRTNFC